MLRCEHGVEVDFGGDCPICETEYEDAARHYESIQEPDVLLVHPDFKPGEVVFLRLPGKNEERVQILHVGMYTNTTGKGPANSAIYVVRSNTGDFSVNGLLLHRE